MSLNRSFRQRIAKLEKNTPPVDDETQWTITIDARIYPDTDMEAAISRCKSGPLSHLTREQIRDFFLGKGIKTVDPTTGCPTIFILGCPEPWKNRDDK
jgi:hypothetical protein